MKKTLIERLNWFNPKSTANKEERRYYEENYLLLPESYRRYRPTDDLFSYIRCDILLAGLKAKKEVDEKVLSLSAEELQREEVLSSLFEGKSFFLFDSKKIFFPFYGETINEIYQKKAYQLKSFPYQVLLQSTEDFLPFPFDLYGNIPYQNIPSLLVIETWKDGTTAFYSESFETILVIDRQGILENEIPLHDEKAEGWTSPTKESLSLLMERYFAADREGFLSVLVERRLLSENLANRLRKELGEKTR